MGSVGIVSLYVVALVAIKPMGPATSIIRISLLLISIIIIKSIKMTEIETDGTIMCCHLGLYSVKYCLILVLLMILVVGNRGINMSTNSITYLIIIHSTEVSKPIFLLPATLSLINRMHCCFISPCLLHYHDHPIGYPLSAHTYCSVEFHLIPLFIQSSQHEVSVCSFLVV